MENYTREDYLKIYKELPDEAKSIFWSEEVIAIIEKLKKRYNIREKNSHLPKIVGLVILGTLPFSKLPETISSRTGIGSSAAERLSDDIKRFILFSIKDFLEKIYNEKFTIWEFRSKDEEIEDIKEGKKAEDKDLKEEIKNKTDDPYIEKI